MIQMKLTQTTVELRPRHAKSVASNRTYWDIIVDGDPQESHLVKAKAREAAKELAEQEKGVYKSYRVEPGVPVESSLSNMIDFTQTE